MSILARTRDGIRLNGWRQGDGASACVLLHGLGDSSAVWAPIARTLSHVFRHLVIMDFRGHGDSDWDVNGIYSTAKHAEDTFDMLQAIGVGRVLVVGHSLGAGVAVHLAASHPELVSGIALVDYSPMVDETVRSTIYTTIRLRAETFERLEDFADLLMQQYPLVERSLIEALVHDSVKGANGKWTAKFDPRVLSSMIQRPDSDGEWGLLSQLSCPSLLIRGRGSAVLAQATAEVIVRDKLRSGSLIVIPRAGHSVHLENPSALNSVLISFAEGIKTRGRLHKRIGAGACNRTAPLDGDTRAGGEMQIL